MNRFRRIALPLLVLVVGLALAVGLYRTGPQVQVRATNAVAPLVRVIAAQPGRVQISAFSHGTVVPRTESELVPEVAGRVLSVSDHLVSGGFFRAGDVLLTIDSLDYEVALEQARAGLARATSDLANARKTLERQQNLSRRQATSESQRDDAQNRVRIGVATLREARARLAKAERDLSRTKVRAPYDGRVRSERVDSGQFVGRGVAVATIYAVDFAEVRVPIKDQELQFLSLPGAFAAQAPGTAAEVVLRARFAGEDHEWRGQVVRTEGELDPTTRMVNVVAQVADPYNVEGGRAPLSVGLFVDAEIRGEQRDNVVVLPRSALRGPSRVLVVDAEQRLRFREVEVLREVQDQVFISGGLSAGELVCISALQNTRDGLLVRIAEESDGSMEEPVLGGGSTVGAGEGS